MNRKYSFFMLSSVIIFLYFISFAFSISFALISDNLDGKISVIIAAVLSVISIIALIKMRRTMAIFFDTKYAVVIKKQPNPELDLYMNSVLQGHHWISYSLLIIQKVLCVAELIIAAVVFFRHSFNNINEESFANAWESVLSYSYLVINLVIVIISFAAFRRWSNESGFLKKSDAEDYLKAKKELAKSNITVFYNRTRYMLSTFGSGHFIGTGTIFVDIENELEQVYENKEEVRSYIEELDNYIFMIDCDDALSSENRHGIPPEKKYDSLEEMISAVEDEYSRLSPLSALTVGVLHAPDNVTADRIRKAFRYPCSIIFIDSIYDIDPLILVKNPDKELYSSVSGNDVSKMDMVLTAVEWGRAADFKELWAALEEESGFETDFGNFSEYFIIMIKEMIFECSDIRRVMFGFDCLELIMRVLDIYIWVCRNGAENHGKYNVPSGFSNIAQRIINNISPDDPHYSDISSECCLTDTAQLCLNVACAYYGFETDGDRCDLCGLVTLLKEIRNKTRGHGIINKNNSGIVWNFIVCMLFYVSRFLNIEKFTFKVSGSDVLCGYEGRIYNMSPLIWVDNGMPCIPVSAGGSNKNSCEAKKYMNFFSGKYVIPEMVGDEAFPKGI